MEKREQWANEVIMSMVGSNRAEPKPELYAKIQSKLSKGKVIKLIPIRHISWVAAAACLLIIANIYVFDTKLKQKPNNKTYTESNIVTDYELY